MQSQKTTAGNSCEIYPVVAVLFLLFLHLFFKTVHQVLSVCTLSVCARFRALRAKFHSSCV